MLRRRTLVWAVVGICIAVALPTLASLYLAHRQTIADERAHATLAASEAMRRAEGMAVQGLSTYIRLASLGTPSCSVRQMVVMRAIDAAAEWPQVTGQVRDGRLACSSRGTHDPALDLGPVAYVSPGGVRTRNAVRLGGNRRFVVFEMNGYATAVLPESLVDFGAADPDLRVGVLDGKAATVLSARGRYDPAWASRLGRKREAFFYDGDNLVAMQRSARFDLVTFAAIPRQALERRLLDTLLVLVPMGLALGGALAAGIVWLARHQASMPSLLKGAVKRCEFALHYQPIVDLATREVVGVEALLRWTRADGSQVRPDVFIPVAEDCGLIQKVTACVVDRLVEDVPRIVRAHPDCHISFNLSAADLHSTRTVALVEGLLAKTGIAPGRLIVEATEHSLVDETDGSQIAAALRALGVRLAIDDFGTGYSSLAYLHRLHSDYLKIDRAFVEAVGTDSATSDVALHIIRIAQSLSLVVIAEGVETESQAEALRAHGAEFGQGWLFGKPMPLPALLERLARATA